MLENTCAFHNCASLSDENLSRSVKERGALNFPSLYSIHKLDDTKLDIHIAIAIDTVFNWHSQKPLKRIDPQNSILAFEIVSSFT